MRRSVKPAAIDDDPKEHTMSFDATAAAHEEDFWRLFVKKYKGKLLDKGWSGPLQPDGVEEAANHDALHDVLSDAVHRDGREVGFDEAEAEDDIPGGGGSDFASIKELCGRYFVTGSYMEAGPFDSADEAADEAGLNG